MDIIKILKEEQKEYKNALLEDIQDGSGSTVAMTPGSSVAGSTLFPTSYSRDSKKVILKRIPTTSMEDFMMRLQLIQNMQAQQQMEQESEEQPEEPSEEQVQANEQFLTNVLLFLSEKKSFNMFGPKTMNTLAALSVATGLGAGGSAIVNKLKPKSTQIKKTVSVEKEKEPKTKQTETETTEKKPVSVVNDMLIPHLKEMERWVPRRYKDSKGLPTVGHGALIDGSFIGTLEKVFPYQSKEWRQKVASGNMELTRAQGHDLLTHHATQKHDEVRDMLGHEMFDSMHPELRTHLASEHFRGMIRKSPKALALIRKGDFAGASKEYLNADDYRENPNNSIGKRMKMLSDALAKHGKGVKIPETK